MRFFSADHIYTSDEEIISDGLVVTDDSGLIRDILKPGDINFPEASKIEKHAGIICPGFVNAHCHLELSHLKNLIPQKTGLDTFIRSLMSIRWIDDETRYDAMKAADDEMYKAGIVAVGDICNGDSSFKIKAESKIYYHSFIELFGFDEANADTAFARGQELQKKAEEITKSKASIVPHSPYSVSPKLFGLIACWAYENNGLLSIHMQENEDENNFFIDKSGPIPARIKDFGIDIDNWQASGFPSLMSTVIYLPKCNPILLVHNTVATKNDILWFRKYTDVGFWCLCPKANLFIENSLPNTTLFEAITDSVCIGTDSLASNTNLSVLEELKTLQQHKDIDTKTLLKWATSNGAKFLGIHNKFGKLRKGMKPGINLISGIDKNKNLLKDSSVRRLI